MQFARVFYLVLVDAFVGDLTKLPFSYIGIAYSLFYMAWCALQLHWHCMFTFFTWVGVI
jgi:hypothetical protein